MMNTVNNKLPSFSIIYLTFIVALVYSIALLQTSFLIDLNERKTSNSKNWFSPPPLTITWML